MSDEASARGRIVDKPWGYELIWVEAPGYVGKVLTIEAGKRLSLQYHERKDEAIFVMSGEMVLHIGDSPENVERVPLTEGDYRRIAPGVVHRFEAVTDTKLLEVSTPDLDDVVRLEDDYGRERTTDP
jgi:mannose-6-phosphate isomerase-like protein (cupin superfamily)